MIVGGYANAISLDLHSTTANRCTDGRQQRCTLHLWQRERLAAILSEAVPLWMETTTLHHCDDSRLGAEGALLLLAGYSLYALTELSIGGNVNRE